VNLIRWLHDWQDLIGALIGGFLGVIGAWIVAQSVVNRERRAAAAMLSSDLTKVKNMVTALTYHRKATLLQLDTDVLIEKLSFTHETLSPMFGDRMAVMSTYDPLLTAQLDGFLQAYTTAEECLVTLQAPRILTANTERASKVLPLMLHYADRFARAALYLLPLYEISAPRRWYWRTRRWLHPDDHDRVHQALIAELQRYTRREQSPDDMPPGGGA
jgi:hypothetical protein